MTRKNAALLVAALLALLPLAAAEAAATGTRNLVYSITIVETSADGQVARRSTRITGRDGTGTDLSAGWRVPIPVKKVDTNGPPVTSFSYQEIGVTALVEGFISEGGDVHARGRVEVSSVQPADESAGMGSGGPTIAHFSQKFDVLLPDGQEVVLAEAPGSNGGSMSLAISVRVQQ